jgi:hypothetical protein
MLLLLSSALHYFKIFLKETEANAMDWIHLAQERK